MLAAVERLGAWGEHVMDLPSLREVIRRKLDDGTLPLERPEHNIYAGYGSGATCGRLRRDDPPRAGRIRVDLSRPESDVPAASGLRGTLGGDAVEARSRPGALIRPDLLVQRPPPLSHRAPEPGGLEDVPRQVQSLLRRPHAGLGLFKEQS
jgi:hypothetical protein